MKKLLSGLGILLISIFLLGFSPSPVQTGPIVKAGDTIYLDGQINGDVILFGGEVVVNATISGDLIVFAAQADISGQVGNDLRVVAGRLALNDLAVNDDVSLAAGQIEVNSSTVLDQSLLIAAGKIRFNGQISGETTILAAAIDIFPQAKFDQSLKLFYGQTPKISSSAQVGGEVTQTYKPSLDQSQFAQKLSSKKSPAVTTLTGLFFLERLATLIVEILIGWLLILLLPELIHRLIKLGSTQASAALGWGFIFLSLTPLIILTLVLTLIGIPIAVVVLLIYIVSLSLAKLLAGLILGSRLLKDPMAKKPYHSLALGALILSLLQIIPVFGWLAYFILVLYGLGILVLSGRALLTRFKKK